MRAPMIAYDADNELFKGDAGQGGEGRDFHGPLDGNHRQLLGERGRGGPTATS